MQSYPAEASSNRSRAPACGAWIGSGLWPSDDQRRGTTQGRLVSGEHRTPRTPVVQGSGERLLAAWLVLGRGVRLDAVLQLGRKLAAVLFAFLLDRLHCRLRDVLAAFERLLAGV